ncbi:uncharacterized protein LOC133839924 [Drosophila sulfurigaster albostrigata]|uniref:uncharacterized protein LOC133839924 n=1 Tax=Drosophila sulfurigaster albostrigata TaxID=89887 RepID=UPI002D21CE3B|nr:uncharacterized protein LOC133839924 [Drosophila sulfurigaster albostrigata]
MVYKSMNIECLPDAKYVVNSTCVVKAENWNKAVLFMDCELILPLRNSTVQMELFKKGYNNRYHPFLINAAFNMCDIISKRNFIPYGTIFWKIIKQYTNVNHSCPFLGHLFARNLYIDANSSFIPRFPLGFYMISFKVSENYPDRPSEHVGLIKYYVHAAEMVQIKKRRDQISKSANG